MSNVSGGLQEWGWVLTGVGKELQAHGGAEGASDEVRP